MNRFNIFLSKKTQKKKYFTNVNHRYTIKMQRNKQFNTLYLYIYKINNY